MRFAHISDTHILGDYSGGLLRFYENRRQTPLTVLPAVLRQAAAAEALDFVVFSGDLVHEGSAEDYALFHQTVSRELAGTPVFYALGNHDREDAFFAGVTGPRVHSEYYYAENVNGLRVIVLDSSHDKSGTGRVGEAQLAWLADTLRVPSPLGSLLVLHHPPYVGASGGMLGHCLANSEALLAALAGGDVRAILSGHTHQPSCTRFGGIPHFTAGSTAFGLQMSGEDIRFTDAVGYNLYDLGAEDLVAYTQSWSAATQTLYRVSMADLLQHTQTA